MNGATGLRRAQTESDGAGISAIEYPLGYFDAQVRFARQWARLSGEPFDKTLLEKTALYRRLTRARTFEGEPDSVWLHFIESVSVLDQPEHVSPPLYSIYLQQPHSVYTSAQYPESDGKHFGYFSFDHYPKRAETGGVERIKIHFINKKRGERSGLDKIYLAQRQSDLQRMFTHIRVTYPAADEVIGASWLYALPSYRDSFPPEYTEQMKRLVPQGFEHIADTLPGMSFGGDSLWGQFVDRRGGVREGVYREFRERIEEAESLGDLVDAFPYKPLRAMALIAVFYEWIDSRI